MGIQLVNFLVTLVVLNILLIRPIREIIRKRRETLDRFAAEAAGLDKRAAKTLADYQAALENARERGAVLRKQAREEAETAGQALLADASGKAHETLRAAADATAADIARTRDALRADIPGLVQAMLTKLVGTAGKTKKVKA